MSEIKINADRYTREKLNVATETLTEQDADQLIRTIQESGNSEFKATRDGDQVVIRRLLRD